MLMAPLLLMSCGGGDDPYPSSSSLSVAITDAPACGFDHVYVTILRVRVHGSTAATDQDSGWQEITPARPIKIDLLSLHNGIMLTLGSMPLAAGEYRQLRLVLAENTPGNMANAIVPSGGGMQALDTISTLRDGLTLIRPITINSQTSTKLVLDFDACRSIVQRDDGSYSLKPVLSSTEMHSSGGITGYVDPGNAGVAIYAEINGTVIKGTIADSSGRFVLAPIAEAPAGSHYDIVFAQENFSTAIIAGVPVNAGTETILATATQPILLPAATMQSVSGTVAPAKALATIYAQQEINGYRHATRLVNANADTGAWEMRLSNAPPLLASFGVLPLGFTTSPADAGHYSISIAPIVGSSQNLGADISTTDVTDLNVDFCAGSVENFGIGTLCTTP